MDEVRELIARMSGFGIAVAKTAEGIVLEAEATKPRHFTLRMGVAVLILERKDRGILSKEEAVRLFEAIL